MTAALDRATALHAEPQFQAFFHVIGAGETSEALTEDDYRRCNVGPSITQWEHPWYGHTTTEVGHSTAAGFAQFLGTSWKECSDALGLGNDFSPVNQRLAAIWTIDVKRHASAQVLAGDIAGAIGKLRDEWVSLPGLTVKRAYEIFRRWGGTTQGEPVEVPTEAPSPTAAPIPASPTTTGGPMGALELVSLLTSVFSPLLRAKLDKVVGTDIGKPLVDGLIAQVTQLTGKADPLEAVAVARQQPAIVAQLEAKTEDWFGSMAPAIDKIASLEKAEWDASEASMDNAAARYAGAAYDPAPMLTYFSVGGVGALTIFMCVWITVIHWNAGSVPTELWAALTGMIGWLTAKLGSIYDNRFGTTRQSAAKDVTIAKMAQQVGKK